MGQQIDSIMNQDDVVATLFISIDASNDGTEDYLDELASTQDRIVLLPHGKQFGRAGLNFYRLIQNVTLSDFNYIAFVDQDDIWNLDKLSRQVRLIQSHHAEAVSSDVIAFWPDGSKKLIIKSQPQKAYDFVFEAAGPGCTFLMTPWLVSMVRKELESSDSLAKNVEMHDWLTYAICRAYKRKWVIDSVPSLSYRQHANNV